MSFLQCPHQGAYASKSTYLSFKTISSKLSPTTTLTGSSLVSGTGALLRCASSLLSLKSYRALVNPSALRSETTNFSKF